MTLKLHKEDGDTPADTHGKKINQWSIISQKQKSQSTEKAVCADPVDVISYQCRVNITQQVSALSGVCVCYVMCNM